MEISKSDKELLKEFKLLEKSAKSADDYMKLARELLNTINEYQGYSKEISNKLSPIKKTDFPFTKSK